MLQQNSTRKRLVTEVLTVLCERSKIARARSDEAWRDDMVHDAQAYSLQPVLQKSSIEW